jgi:hypothetical protein
MQLALAKRIDQLVDYGWEPHTTTETTASLYGRRPFNWWVFLLVVIFFPIFGGIVYLLFWLLTSKATVFLHQEGEEVVSSGDLWLVRLQEAQHQALVAEQRQIKERGFWAVMWPKLVVFLLLFVLWIVFLRWYLH